VSARACPSHHRIAPSDALPLTCNGDLRLFDIAALCCGAAGIDGRPMAVWRARAAHQEIRRRRPVARAVACSSVSRWAASVRPGVGIGSVRLGAVDPQIRLYLQEAEKADALADSQFADVLTGGQFRRSPRSGARWPRWDGESLGPGRAASIVLAPAEQGLIQFAATGRDVRYPNPGHPDSNGRAPGSPPRGAPFLGLGQRGGWAIWRPWTAWRPGARP